MSSESVPLRSSVSMRGYPRNPIHRNSMYYDRRNFLVKRVLGKLQSVVLVTEVLDVGLKLIHHERSIDNFERVRTARRVTKFKHGPDLLEPIARLDDAALLLPLAVFRLQFDRVLRGREDQGRLTCANNLPKLGDRRGGIGPQHLE